MEYRDPTKWLYDLQKHSWHCSNKLKTGHPEFTHSFSFGEDGLDMLARQFTLECTHCGNKWRILNRFLIEGNLPKSLGLALGSNIGKKVLMDWLSGREITEDDLTMLRKRLKGLETGDEPNGFDMIGLDFNKLI